jgi:hypothetical protein
MQRSKFVFQETAGDQGVDVQKKPHRKVDEISCTFLLVRVGAFGPALRAGRLVIESRGAPFFSGFCGAWVRCRQLRRWHRADRRDEAPVCCGRD